jgi:hypothetical protein
VYLELTPSGFSPSQAVAATGERVVFVVRNRTGAGCSVRVGSWAGPAVPPGATATATVRLAGRGRLVLGCGPGGAASIVVR